MRSRLSTKSRNRRGLRADVAGIEAARHARVGRAFDDGPAVRKERHFVWLVPELENEIVVTHGAEGLQAAAELAEIYRTVPFVDLHRVSAAKGDMRPAFALEVNEIVLLTTPAVWLRTRGGDFCPLIGPDVPGEQCTAKLLAGSN